MSLWKYPVSYINYIDEIRGFHLTIGDIKKLNQGDEVTFICFSHHIDNLINHNLYHKIYCANTFFKHLHNVIYTHIGGLYGIIHIKNYDNMPKDFEFSIECRDNMWYPLQNGIVQPNAFEYFSYPEYYGKLWTEFPDTTRIGIYDIKNNLWNGPIVYKKHMKYFPKVYRQDSILLHQQILHVVNSI